MDSSEQQKVSRICCLLAEITYRSNIVESDPLLRNKLRPKPFIMSWSKCDNDLYVEYL